MTLLVRPFMLGTALAVFMLAADRPPLEAKLQPETVAAWKRYVEAGEARRSRERADGTRFLVMDFQPTAAAERQAALAGQLVVREMEGRPSGAAGIEIPSGRVHHWRGAIFIPGPSVSHLLSQIEFSDPPAVQEDVIRSSVLARSPGAVRTYLRLRRSKIVTAVYNTEHDVRFAMVSPSRAESISVSTRIAEVRDPGTPQETELPVGDDRGFLWRLNGYWRYEAVPGGVLAECESISLSRDVPFMLDLVASPIINSTARESMERTLVALRQRYRKD
jgi:hypothetical protein